MSTDEGSSGAPGVEGLQFERIEPVAAAEVAVRACPRCKRALGEEYFEAQGRMICRSCAADLKSGGAAAWFRALAFGGAAAVAGTLAWFLIIKLRLRT
jgi:hypothetical protein